MISVRGSAGEVAMQAVDGEVDHGGANGGAARGGANPARGRAGAGLDQDVGQGEEVGKLWVSGIWAR
jgi:hypothetical protein